MSTWITGDGNRLEQDESGLDLQVKERMVGVDGVSYLVTDKLNEISPITESLEVNGCHRFENGHTFQSASRNTTNVDMDGCRSNEDNTSVHSSNLLPNNLNTEHALTLVQTYISELERVASNIENILKSYSVNVQNKSEDIEKRCWSFSDENKSKETENISKSFSSEVLREFDAVVHSCSTKKAEEPVYNEEIVELHSEKASKKSENMDTMWKYSPVEVTWEPVGAEKVVKSFSVEVVKEMENLETMLKSHLFDVTNESEYTENAFKSHSIEVTREPENKKDTFQSNSAVKTNETGHYNGIEIWDAPSCPTAERLEIADGNISKPRDLMKGDLKLATTAFKMKPRLKNQFTFEDKFSNGSINVVDEKEDCINLIGELDKYQMLNSELQNTNAQCTEQATNSGFTLHSIGQSSREINASKEGGDLVSNMNNNCACGAINSRGIGRLDFRLQGAKTGCSSGPSLNRNRAGGKTGHRLNQNSHSIFRAENDLNVYRKLLWSYVPADIKDFWMKGYTKGKNLFSFCRNEPKGVNIVRRVFKNNVPTKRGISQTIFNDTNNNGNTTSSAPRNLSLSAGPTSGSSLLSHDQLSLKIKAQTLKNNKANNGNDVLIFDDTKVYSFTKIGMKSNELIGKVLCDLSETKEKKTRPCLLDDECQIGDLSEKRNGDATEMPEIIKIRNRKSRQFGHLPNVAQVSQVKDFTGETHRVVKSLFCEIEKYDHDTLFDFNSKDTSREGNIKTEQLLTRTEIEGRYTKLKADAIVGETGKHVQIDQISELELAKKQLTKEQMNKKRTRKTRRLNNGDSMDRKHKSQNEIQINNSDSLRLKHTIHDSSVANRSGLALIDSGDKRNLIYPHSKKQSTFKTQSPVTTEDRWASATGSKDLKRFTDKKIECSRSRDLPLRICKTFKQAEVDAYYVPDRTKRLTVECPIADLLVHTTYVRPNPKQSENERHIGSRHRSGRIYLGDEEDFINTNGTRRLICEAECFSTKDPKTKNLVIENGTPAVCHTKINDMSDGEKKMKRFNNTVEVGGKELVESEFADIGSRDISAMWYNISPMTMTGNFFIIGAGKNMSPFLKMRRLRSIIAKDETGRNRKEGAEAVYVMGDDSFERKNVSCDAGTCSGSGDHRTEAKKRVAGSNKNNNDNNNNNNNNNGVYGQCTRTTCSDVREMLPDKTFPGMHFGCVKFTTADGDQRLVLPNFRSHFMGNVYCKNMNTAGDNREELPNKLSQFMSNVYCKNTNTAGDKREELPNKVSQFMSNVYCKNMNTAGDNREELPNKVSQFMSNVYCKKVNTAGDNREELPNKVSQFMSSRRRAVRGEHRIIRHNIMSEEVHLVCGKCGISYIRYRKSLLNKRSRFKRNVCESNEQAGDNNKEVLPNIGSRFARKVCRTTDGEHTKTILSKTSYGVHNVSEKCIITSDDHTEIFSDKMIQIIHNVFCDLNAIVLNIVWLFSCRRVNYAAYCSDLCWDMRLVDIMNSLCVYYVGEDVKRCIVVARNQYCGLAGSVFLSGLQTLSEISEPLQISVETNMNNSSAQENKELLNMDGRKWIERTLTSTGKWDRSRFNSRQRKSQSEREGINFCLECQATKPEPSHMNLEETDFVSQVQATDINPEAGTQTWEQYMTLWGSDLSTRFSKKKSPGKDGSPLSTQHISMGAQWTSQTGGTEYYRKLFTPSSRPSSRGLPPGSSKQEIDTQVEATDINPSNITQTENSPSLANPGFTQKSKMKVKPSHPSNNILGGSPAIGKVPNGSFVDARGKKYKKVSPDIPVSIIKHAGREKNIPTAVTSQNLKHQYQPQPFPNQEFDDSYEFQLKSAILPKSKISSSERVGSGAHRILLPLHEDSMDAKKFHVDLDILDGCKRLRQQGFQKDDQLPSFQYGYGSEGPIQQITYPTDGFDPIFNRLYGEGRGGSTEQWIYKESDHAPLSNDVSNLAKIQQSIGVCEDKIRHKTYPFVVNTPTAVKKVASSPERVAATIPMMTQNASNRNCISCSDQIGCLKYPSTIASDCEMPKKQCRGDAGHHEHDVQVTAIDIKQDKSMQTSKSLLYRTPELPRRCPYRMQTLIPSKCVECSDCDEKSIALVGERRDVMIQTELGRVSFPERLQTGPSLSALGPFCRFDYKLKKTRPDKNDLFIDCCVIEPGDTIICSQDRDACTDFSQQVSHLEINISENTQTEINPEFIKFGGQIILGSSHPRFPVTFCKDGAFFDCSFRSSAGGGNRKTTRNFEMQVGVNDISPTKLIQTDRCLQTHACCKPRCHKNWASECFKSNEATTWAVADIGNDFTQSVIATDIGDTSEAQTCVSLSSMRPFSVLRPDGAVKRKCENRTLFGKTRDFQTDTCDFYLASKLKITSDTQSQVNQKDICTNVGVQTCNQIPTLTKYYIRNQQWSSRS